MNTCKAGQKKAFLLLVGASGGKRGGDDKDLSQKNKEKGESYRDLRA